MDTFWGLASTAWTGIYTLLTGALLIVAVAAAVYARAQWRASRQQVEDARRAQLEVSRPYVIVAAESTAAARNLFDLSVKNIGRRPALNVSIRFDPPPTAATLTPGYEMDKLRMLREPIAMIAPDQDMRAFWDSHAERHGREDLPQSHRVSVSYSDSSGNTYNEESVVDLAAMEGATYVVSKSIHDIGQTLDKMEKTLRQAPILSRNGRAEVLVPRPSTFALLADTPGRVRCWVAGTRDRVEVSSCSSPQECRDGRTCSGPGNHQRRGQPAVTHGAA